MRTIYLYIVAVALAISGLYSCNNEDDAIHSVQDQTADLYIETEIAVAETGLRSTKALLSNFQEGSALSLFVTNGTMGTNYPQGPYNNVKAQYNAAKWILEPKVKLSDTPATIFAFYPYTEAIGNGVGSIYVQHTDQIDYMYGTHAEGQGEINKHNTGVRLSMKHALSLLEFKMHKDYYKGEGKLTKIEVRNAQYTDMYSRGTINLETGVITGYYGRHEPAIIENNEGLLEIPDVLSPDTDDYQRIMVLPSTNKNTGNIVVDFHIDGDIYTWKVPQGNTWKPGSKYSYDITLNGATLNVTDVKIIDWVSEPTDNLSLY